MSEWTETQLSSLRAEHYEMGFQRGKARIAELERELDEIALATGFGERPEGQDGVHRAPDLALRLGKLSRERNLHRDMREVAESTIEGIAKWLGMDAQGLHEDPSSVVLPLRAEQAKVAKLVDLLEDGQPDGMHSPRCRCLWHTAAREALALARGREEGT